MISKRAMTKKFLKELGLETDGKSIRTHHRIWWMNPRHKDDCQSYRLTESGLYMFQEGLKIKSYEVKYPSNLPLVYESGFIINIDKYLDCPFYLNATSIILFKEKPAVELILYEGDIWKYIKAKESLRKNNS
jgi:hypothetical protein